jgi:hypothetical protein
MSTIHFEGPLDSQAHSSKALDENVWRAWLTKNRLEEGLRAAARIKAVKWGGSGLLMAAAVVSAGAFAPSFSTYQIAIRVAIGLSAIILLFESLRTRQYAFTALFAAIAVLFNSALPIFTLAGNWLILLASVLPFVASLVWMKEQSQRVLAATQAIG